MTGACSACPVKATGTRIPWLLWTWDCITVARRLLCGVRLLSITAPTCIPCFHPVYSIAGSSASAGQADVDGFRLNAVSTHTGWFGQVHFKCRAWPSGRRGAHRRMAPHSSGPLPTLLSDNTHHLCREAGGSYPILRSRAWRFSMAPAWAILVWTELPGLSFPVCKMGIYKLTTLT